MNLIEITPEIFLETDLTKKTATKKEKYETTISKTKSNIF